MSDTILLTGGTGTLGRRVLAHLRPTGHPVRVLTRGAHPDEDGVTYVTGDLTTGDGIDAAVDDVATIVHCAGAGRGDDETTRTLVRAAARQASGEKPHLVFISVVGADRVPVVSRVDRAMFGYFWYKRAAERVVEESGLPWTTLRATQFYDLTLTVARAMAKLPVIPVPAGVRFQPVETDEVAVRLTELALDRPAGLVPDLAGPRVYTMDELVRGYLRAARKRRALVPLPLGGRAYRAIRAGANIAPDRAVGHRTWEEFLAERVQNERGHAERGKDNVGTPTQPST